MVSTMVVSTMVEINEMQYSLLGHTCEHDIYDFAKVMAGQHGLERAHLRTL